MSWTFDESGDYVTLADNAALTFQDGDQTIGGWVKFYDNDGSNFQYFLSWNNFAATPSYNLYLGEASQPTTAQRNKLMLWGAFDNGTYLSNSGSNPLVSTANLYTGATWRHVIVRYKKSTKTIEFFIGGSADASIVITGVETTLNHSGPLFFGGRADLNISRFLGGKMAEWAKWDTYLSNETISALAGGASPADYATGRSWYLPMRDFTESDHGITVTPYGDVSVDLDDHPISYSNAAQLGGASAASATATGTLEASGAALAGQASGVSTATGSLVSQSAELAGAAQAEANPTGALENAPASLAGAATAESSATGTLRSVVISSPEDRGTLLLSACSVTPDGTTPTVTLKSRFANDSGATGARALYCKVSGVNGMTPAFRLDRSNWGISISASWKFLYSYDGTTWNTLDNFSSDASYYYFSHGTAFTADEVYLAAFWPWRIGDTLPWIQSLESSGYVFEAESSAGNDYVFDTRSATLNELGETISASPMYSFKISLGAGNAPDGFPKRKMMLTAGVHASEEVGDHALRGAVEFLVSGDSQALALLAWFDVYVYPVVATAGRKGAGQRNDFQTGYLTTDVNREWDTSILETLVKHKAAAQTDCGDTVHVQFDFHGNPTSATFDYVQAGTDQATWTAAIQAYRPGLPQTTWNTVGTTNHWAYTYKGAIFSINPEHTYLITTVALADVYDWGADHMRAMSDIADSGYFSLLSGNAAAEATATGSLSSAPTDIAGAAVSVSTPTGALLTGIHLGGVSAAVVTSQGDPQFRIELNGTILAQALAQAGLDTSILVGGGAGGEASVSGALSGGAAQLGGAVQVVVTPQATIHIIISLDGNSTAAALVQGELAGGAAQLGGAAQAVAQVLGALLTEIPLAGGAQVFTTVEGYPDTAIELLGASASISSVTGALLTEIPLAGNVQAFTTVEGMPDTTIVASGAVASVSSATGALTIGVTFSGAALVQALAVGDLTTIISLDGDALAQAAVSGSLGGGTGIPDYIPHEAEADWGPYEAEADYGPYEVTA